MKFQLEILENSFFLLISHVLGFYVIGTDLFPLEKREIGNFSQVRGNTSNKAQFLCYVIIKRSLASKNYD